MAEEKIGTALALYPPCFAFPNLLAFSRVIRFLFFFFELVPVPAAELADSASAVLFQRFEFFFRFSSDRELVFSLDPFFPTGEDFHPPHPPFESNFLVVFGGGLGGPELDTIIQSEEGL